MRNEWQSNTLIDLLVLSHEQIYVPTWVSFKEEDDAYQNAQTISTPLPVFERFIMRFDEGKRKLYYIIYEQRQE